MIKAIDETASGRRSVSSACNAARGVYPGSTSCSIVTSSGREDFGAGGGTGTAFCRVRRGVGSTSMPAVDSSMKRMPSCPSLRHTTRQKRRDLPSLLKNRPKTLGIEFTRGAAIRAPPSEISQSTQGMGAPPPSSTIEAALRRGVRFAFLSSRPRARVNAPSDDECKLC